MSTESGRTLLAPNHQLAIVWGLSATVILFFLLINLSNDVEFKSTIIFQATIIVSIFITIVLLASSRGHLLKGNKAFFFNNPLKMKPFFIWFSICFSASFIWAIAVQNMGLNGFASLSQSEVEGLLTLFGSGMFFVVALERTGSIITPVFSHGLFNSIVFAMSKTGFGADFIQTQSLPIPLIGIPLGDVNQILVESIFQFMLVALAEEHYRVMVIALFLVIFKKSFKDSILKVYLAGAFSVVIWAVLHLPNAFS